MDFTMVWKSSEVKLQAGRSSRGKQRKQLWLHHHRGASKRDQPFKSFQTFHFNLCLKICNTTVSSVNVT